MAEDNEEMGKTVRTSLESLAVTVTTDELKYRNKYLPDPRRLTNDKIVCTVCSGSLASRVRKGKDIYVHRILGVLVCKACYSFYGDGNFSADEDGDDKYCRWCGQGGTLYLCSACNCGFCKNCMMKNMKNSALAGIEKDDWKCLICIPRPIFGSRAICWASQELNKIARKNEQFRLRLEEEKSRLTAPDEETEVNGRRSVNLSEKEDNVPKKRKYESEDSDSSSVFIPAKKSKESIKTKRSLNGSIKKHRRKNKGTSSESEASEDKHSSKLETRKRNKHNKSDSSSSDECSSENNRSKKKEKHRKKSKTCSDDLSDDDENASKRRSKKTNGKSCKIKRVKNLAKRKRNNTSDSSSSELSEEPLTTKKKKHKKKRRKSLSDASSEESISVNEKKQETESTKDSTKDLHSAEEANVQINGDKSKQETVINNEIEESGNELKSESSKEEKLLPVGKLDVGKYKEQTTENFTDNKNHVNIIESHIFEQNANEPAEELNQNQSLGEDVMRLSYRGSDCNSEPSEAPGQDGEVKVKVLLAIEWLEGVTNDIADLGTLIAERANRFGEKKVNLESLSSYEDVISTLGRLKLLFGGIHANYKQIEDSLEDKLKSWKMLTGLEETDLKEPSEVPLEEENVLVERSDLQGEEIPNSTSKCTKDESESCTKMDSVDLPQSVECPNNELQMPPVGEDEEKDTQVIENSSNIASEPGKTEGDQLILSQDGGKLLVEAHSKNEVSTDKEPQNKKDLDCAKNKAELNFLSCESSNLVWSGLLSSDDDSDLTDKNESGNNMCQENDKEENICVTKKTDENTDSVEKEIHDTDVNHVKVGDSNGKSDGQVEELKPALDDKEAKNFEALQELLYSSTEEEIESSASSDSSVEIDLDDSDLDILKPRKIITKRPKKKESIRKQETNEDNKVKIEIENEEENNQKEKISEKKIEEALDSEAEIDMLTDLSKLKKKTIIRQINSQESSSSEESSSEESEEGGSNEEMDKNKKKRRKYKNESKKKREEEREELLGFLHGDSDAEDKVDITRDDLDVMEDHYASSSSESMSLEAFSRKMNEKHKELEKQQDDMNLQMLLASESEDGSVGGDDLILESDDEKKKNKGPKKIKEEKNIENDIKEEKDDDVNVKEENDSEEEGGEMSSQVKPDEEYEQFLEDMAKTRTTFTGLGSSSEDGEGERKEEPESEEIEIKEEPLSDAESKINKEAEDSDDEGSSNSDSSNLFLNLSKKKSGKKPVWRHHRLLRMKLSDTDTSDEERWWKRRLERERKKKEEGESDSSEFDEFSQALSSKKSRNPKKNGDSGSDKENKKTINKERKEKEEEEEEEDDDGEEEDDDGGSSSTLEMSSTESSGSDIFKKKKRKRKDSSDSDVIAISDTDKKKKKKKKKLNLSGESSDESDDSGDDVIDITQKSSQGESPGKGGRKNIRKVLTKHELAAATKAAAKEEEERKKRIAARQKMFNEMFEIKEAEVLEKLVLDFDPETKTELISVDKDLVVKMKPHQAKGVKFMWDSCFESLSQLRTKKGSGCILAHCMGLGKTFQVISLVHTILKHKDTHVRTVLVVCPLSTVLNWYNEFDKWLEDVAGGRDIKIYHLTKFKRAHERSRQLSQWHRTGGVMILGYEMFRILANPNCKKFRLQHMEIFQKTLIDPGADLVVCDEGHMLKNESTVLSKAMSRIKTLRRIVLTGTPMQNNLKEYHCMVQFVKPNLLGTRKEFLNQFVNPITNGQFVDSTEADVKVMKRRAHVLHKMLEGLVQRFDYSVLTPFLPPKHEYVISLRLSDVQVKLYQFYMDHFSQKSHNTRTGSQLFQDWQALGRIWTHPRVLKMSTDKAEKEREKRELSDSDSDVRKTRSQSSIKDFFKKTPKTLDEKKSDIGDILDLLSPSESTKVESEDEGSIKDFINDKSSSSSLSLSSSHSSSSSDEGNGEKKNKEKKSKREKKRKDKEKKETEKKEPEKKEETPVVDGPVAEPVDEINLISSDEEDGDKKDRVNIVEETEVPGPNQEIGIKEVPEVEHQESQENDLKTDNEESRAEEIEKEIENKDPEDKTEDKPQDENEKPEGTDNTVENKEEEKQESKEEEKQESKEEEKQESKEENGEEEKKKSDVKLLDRKSSWWKDIIEPTHLDDINQSAKLVLLFAILRECEMIEDKVLVFSQSLFSLDLIEYFLEKVDHATEENRLDESLGNHAGCWQKGLDYFRLDGSSSSENRSVWCKSFNREDNIRARLFLISTRAGGLGINLTAANRVVIFDASWNPSHDVQSIFRIYRFGQKKPCYVYRFIAHGTMEEKVYDRQVAKQSLSSRVVDEQQVSRHFSMNDLNELYTFTPPQDKGEKPTPSLPRDRLMAELLTQYNDMIEKFHEHDSLLENIAEEELNEEERKLAWEDYENEKKRGFLPPAPGMGGIPNMSGPAVANQLELFRKSLRLKSMDILDLDSGLLSSPLSPITSSSSCSSDSEEIPDPETLVPPSMDILDLDSDLLSSPLSPITSSSSCSSDIEEIPDPETLVPPFPNATDQEMNAMLQTLMFQVNVSRMPQQTRQFTGPQPHQQGQQSASTSQGIQQNYQIVPNTMTAQQVFNAQRNYLYQKYGQQMQTDQQPRQRMGNSQIKQQHSVQAKTAAPESYMDQMRRQQEANLSRIQNQRRMQAMQQRNIPGQQSVQQRNIIRQQPQQNVRNISNIQKSQQHQPTQNKPQQVPNVWKSNQPLPIGANQLQMQKQRQTAGNLMKNRQVQMIPFANRAAKTMPNNSRVSKTPQQLQQEQMRQRINELKLQKQQSLQQRVQERTQGDAQNLNAQKKKLEEMKKRYNASRQSTQPISVVEIDDEPTEL